MESDKDYLHMLLEYPPTLSISKIVKTLKQESTYNAWNKYKNYLRRIYWHEHTLWSDGYFACSVGEASEETIRNYIQNQG